MENSVFVFKIHSGVDLDKAETMRIHKLVLTSKVVAKFSKTQASAESTFKLY